MTVLAIVELVVRLLPLIVSDVEAVATLLSNAGHAIASAQASPSGEVSADAWSKLLAQETAVMQQIDAEAKNADVAQPPPEENT